MSAAEATGDVGGRATLEAVARHARVSRQTISNALNAPHRLAPDTLDRVLRAIDELGYVPNQAARSLRTNTSRQIGFRIEPARDGINGSVLDRFLHALCDEAKDLGYNVLLFTAADDQDEISAYDELLRRSAVDAFVLSSTHSGDRRTSWLRERGAPFVTFGRPWGEQSPAHSWVDVDGAAGTQAAVAHCVALGHRRIGFVGWPLGSGVGDDRHTGWLRGLRDAGLPSRGLTVRGEDGVSSGEVLAGKLLDSRTPATAIICVSDSFALGALRALSARGLEPGRDVAVVGFDDTPVAAAVPPGLTSVRQPIEQVAAEIVRELTAHLSGSRSAPAGVLIPPSLVVRGSSTPPVG
jgi:DNA-binding LacI/PurR family transcriptional regulator